MHRCFDKDSESFIDAFRGLAACGVLLTHAVDFGTAGVYGTDMALTPEPWRWVRASIGHGGFFVWSFFVISGICIHRSIARSMAANTFSLRRYFAARVTRIYPLFMLGLLLAVLVWWFTNEISGEPRVKPWPQFLASLFSLQVLTATFPNYNPSWSLSNEMIYYFVWPLALLLFGGCKIGRAFFICMVSTLLLALVIVTLWNAFHSFDQSALVGGMWTITVLFPLWAAGAWLGATWETVCARISLRLWLWSVPLCVLSALLLVILKFKDSPPWARDLAGLSSMPGLIIFIAGAHHARLAQRDSTRRMSQWLGQFSYPCYVLHFQMMVVLDRTFLPELGGAVARNPLLRALILLVPVFLLLAIVGPWMERRTLAWRARFLAKSHGKAAFPAG